MCRGAAEPAAQLGAEVQPPPASLLPGAPAIRGGCMEGTPLLPASSPLSPSPPPQKLRPAAALAQPAQGRAAGAFPAGCGTTRGVPGGAGAAGAGREDPGAAGAAAGGPGQEERAGGRAGHGQEEPGSVPPAGRGGAPAGEVRWVGGRRAAVVLNCAQGGDAVCFVSSSCVLNAGTESSSRRL